MWSNLVRAATERLPNDGWDGEDILDDADDDFEDADLLEDDDVDNDDEILNSEVDDDSRQQRSTDDEYLAEQREQETPSPSIASSSTATGGGGVFMGRLTRFLENVTSPDDDDQQYYDSEDQESGWDQDEGILQDIGVEDAGMIQQHQQQQEDVDVEPDLISEDPQSGDEFASSQQQHTQQADVFHTPDHSEEHADVEDAPVVLEPPPPAAPAAPAVVEPEPPTTSAETPAAADGWDESDNLEFSEKDNDAGGGWGGDDDIEFSENTDNAAATPQQPEEAAVVEALASMAVEPAAAAAVTAAQPEEVPTPGGGGWDDDDDIEFSENNNNANVEPAVAPAAAQPAESSPPPVTDDDGGGGWDDDDLEFSENFTTQETPVVAVASASSPMADSEPEDGVAGPELVAFSQQADHRLKAVMKEIDDQEQQQNLSMVAQGTPARSDDMAVFSDTDDEHAQAAVLEIQQEMNELVQTQQRPQQQRVVDHTPLQTDAVVENQPGSPNAPVGNEEQDDPSMVVLAALEDRSRDTGPLRDDLSDEQDVYDDENEMAYGPVVDHLPSKLKHDAKSGAGDDSGDLQQAYKLERADSLKVQLADATPEEEALLDASSQYDDDDDDDEEDNNKSESLSQPVLPTVVDHTPAVVGSGSTTGTDDADTARRNSMGVLAESEVDTLDAEDDVDFGDEDNMVVLGMSGLGDTDNSKDDQAGDRPGLRHTISTRSNFGPMVDHTPNDNGKDVDQAGASAPPTSGSLAVNAEALEEDFQQDDDMDDTHYDTTTGADGWDDDDDIGLDDDDDDKNAENVTTDDDEDKSEPKPVVFEQKLTFFSPETAHVVDHTPSDDDDMTALTSNNMDPSIVVLVPDQDDLTRDTGNGRDEEVYDDENEEEYGLVVDHTPQTPAAANGEQGGSALNLDEAGGSMAVHASALKKDFEEDEKMDESCFGDSTLDDGLAGAEGDEEDAWGHDDAVLGDDNAPTHTAKSARAVMVDHTPSEMVGDTSSVPAISDPSVDVVASEGNTKDAGDDDGDVVYGPMVDHTPTTPAHTEEARSTDSVVVQAADLATVDDDDETTMVGTSTVGDVTVDDEIAGSAPARSPEDQMVDHVPARPESRFGDASTLVAADPSEVLSEVDDMTQEGGGNYGPVVDQTPPPQMAASGSPGQPSGAGSTVVFAPSVQVDDLDDPDETEVAEDEEDNFVVEATPNPQSGGDEPVVPPVVAEQPVVDVIPPENEVVVPPGGLSEITIGGAQSLLQAEDPKEDDFGPVVDQIPDGRSAALSLASIATQLTASECRALERDDAASAAAVGGSVGSPKAEIVVDHLPQDKMTADSVATIGRSQFSEDAEEEDDSKFGPVVDHLPTPVLSTGPSRGGSTVDALGTVSEANSDVADGDGWDDDDVDFDVSESNMSEGAVLATPSARPALRQPNETPSDQERMSVRFDSSVNESATAESLNGNQSYDPNVGDSGVKSEATKYFDPDSGTSSDWGDAIALDNSSGSPKMHSVNKTFAEMDTPPSTPYRRSEEPLRPVEEDGAKPKPDMPGLNEGPPRCGRCEETSSTECPCVQKFLKANDSEGSLVGTMTTPEGKTVEVDFSKLLQEEMAKRKLVEEECKALRERLGAAETSSPVKPRKIALPPPRVPGAEQGSSELLNRVAELESDCAGLRDRNEALSKNLAAAKSTAKMLEMSGANLGKEGNLENEFLRDAKDALAKQVLDLEAQHKDELEQQYQLLDEKSSEMRELEEAKVSLEKERTRLVKELKEKRALANQAESLAIELLSVAEERDVLQESLHKSNEQVASLQNLIDEHGMEQEALQSKRHGELVELKKQVKDLTEALSVSDNAATKLREECVALVDEKNALSSKLSEVESTSESLKTAAESARLDAEREASNAKGFEEELSRIKDDLVQVSSERDQNLADKQKASSHLAELGRTMKQMHEQADAWKGQMTDLENRIAQKESESQALAAERDALVSERDQLAGRCQELQSSREASLAGFNQKMEESRRQGTEALAAADRENEQLKEQLLAAKLVEQELEAERARVEGVLEERAVLTEDNEEMLVQLGLHKQQMDAADEHIKTLEADIKSLLAQLQAAEEKDRELDALRQDTQALREQVDALAAENASLSQFNGLDSRCQQLEATCSQQETELSSLRERLQADEASKQNLQETVHALEVTSDEKDRAIAARDSEIEHLESRMTSMVDRSERLHLKNELAQKEQDVFQQTALAGEWEKKCESLLSELNDTRARVVAADSLPDFQKQVESLGAALKATRARLALKEKEVDRLSSKLVSLGSSTRDHPESVAAELPSDDDLDNLDAVKSKVVSLAVALERSENKRAEAMERLQAERLEYNESLRKLTESLKRYYSAVSISDAA